MILLVMQWYWDYFILCFEFFDFAKLVIINANILQQLAPQENSL
jgi:hypothetical protein